MTKTPSNNSSKKGSFVEFPVWFWIAGALFTIGYTNIGPEIKTLNLFWQLICFLVIYFLCPLMLGWELFK